MTINFKKRASISYSYLNCLELTQELGNVDITVAENLFISSSITEKWEILEM